MGSLDGAAVSIVRWTYNSVYFTQEQFSMGLHFPIPSLVKQFIHFTQAPPALIHPNVFRIFMGYSVLNSFYQLDISMIEIYLIYTLKLRIGGHLYMSAHSPRLQFVIGLPDFPKIEAKWVILVKGPWYEMSGSPGLLFDLNQSLFFPSLSQLNGAFFFFGGLPHSDFTLFFGLCM